MMFCPIAKLSNRNWNTLMRNLAARVTAPLAALPHVWRASPGPFILLSLFLLLQGIAGPATALLLGKTVSSFSQGTFELDLPQLALYWGLLTGISLIAFPVVFILSGRLNEDLSAYLQSLLLRRGMSLQTMELFDNPEAYDIISLVVRESKSRPVNYIVLYSYILRGTISVLCYAGILWSIAWYIPILIILAALPLHRAFTAIREVNWTGIRKRAQTARFLDYYVELFLQRETAMETRAHGMQKIIQLRFEQDRDAMFSELRRERRMGFIRNLPFIAIGVIVYVIAITLLLMKSNSSGIAIAGIAASMQAFSAMQQTVSEVVENLAFLREKAFFFKDLDALLEFSESTLPKSSLEKDGLMDKVMVSEASEKRPDSILEFRKVGFTYLSASAPAIQDISFSIQEGETVAIVGKNGAGKSTLVKLLCGFYGPSEGEIFFKGERLAEDNVTQWRESVSPIFQNTTAFSMNFADNILLGLPMASDSVENSAHAAFGNAIPRDYNDLLGVEFGGSEFSGGELQRLGLARAFARGGSFVVLDEPTSAIDPIFEAEVFSAIKEFIKNRSAIIITHRMPQALMADKVIVLEDGRIVEYGSPNELILKNGEFANMVRVQAAPFIDTDKS
ncbi:MAG: ATP-binding cassette domain-containing protein [Propionibacteriaceae bacterium]